MELYIDVASLENAYWGNAREIVSNSYDPSVNSSVLTVYRDPRIQDAITLYERETKSSITDPLGQPYGYIHYKVPVSYIRPRGTGLVVLSSFMLMIPNVLGMPFGAYETNLEVEVEILNANREIIGRYQATGKGKALVAIWWGYTSADAERVSNIEAIKMAMQDIKKQILADHAQLYTRLQESGPIIYR
jgi:hypothetical protein